MSSEDRHPTALALRLFLIAAAVTAVVALRVAVKRMPAPRRSEPAPVAVALLAAPGEPIRAEAQVFRTTPGTVAIDPGARRERTAHPRNLKTRRFLRAYPGAPPRIPHAVTPEEFRTDACRTCHERGGFSKRFDAYVPVTPHPERGVCLQCHVGEDSVIRRAIENADRETAMREELQDVVKAFLERTCKGRKHPVLPDNLLVKIIALAKFGARMRGSVSRDFYRNDLVTSRPMAEVGTRLGQQLAKLARGLAMVYGKDEVTAHEYDLVKKVMLDTISQRNEDVLRTLIGAMGGTEQLTPMSMRDLAQKTHYPFETIRRLMQDLQALQIIKKQGAGALSTWTLSDYVLKEILVAELYTQAHLAQHTGRIRLRNRRKRKFKRTIRMPLGQVHAASSGGRISITIPSTVPTAPEDDQQKP